MLVLGGSYSRARLEQLTELFEAVPLEGGASLRGRLDMHSKELVNAPRPPPPPPPLTSIPLTPQPPPAPNTLTPIT